jgi:hypothetical protein
MVVLCPGDSVVRERHSALCEFVGGLPGLLDRPIMSERVGMSVLQEQWNVADSCTSAISCVGKKTLHTW